MTARLAGWAGLVASISALNYAARATAGRPPEDVLYEYSTAAGALIQYALIMLVVLLIARGTRIARLLALRRPRSWGRAAALAFGVLVGVYLIGAALEPFLQAGREQGLTPSDWDPSRGEAYAANFVVIAGLAPVVEELTFRGLGFTLLERFGRPAAILLPALAFALTHGLVAALPILTIFGIGLGYLRSRTGSVYPPIVLHAAFNAIALVVSVIDLPD